MMDKAQFLDSCAHEIRVIRHLATKVPPGALDWKPTPAQRSTLDLLRYLTTAAIVPTRAMISGNWDGANETEKAAESLAPEGFDAAMATQEALIREAVAPLSERDLAERDATLPWGAPSKLGAALVDTALKPLVAYRMQLFLYAKAAGNAAIGPADCWAGVSRPAG